MPVVISMILISGSFWNFATREARADPQTLPSMRTNVRLFDRRRGSTRSSVVFQHEKTMLLVR